MAAIIGVLLFIGAFPLLWWNEGRSVHRYNALAEGRNLVTSISADTLMSQNEDKLVHISNIATTDEILKDGMFGVQENALKLKRIVEMYQWTETKTTHTKKEMGGGETKETTYNYSKVWSQTPISSAQFHVPAGHQNPDSMPYKGQVFTAGNIDVGLFRLSSGFVKKIDSYEDYPLTERNADAMNGSLKKYFTFTGSGYFHGNIHNPEVGALRVNYKIIRPTDVSVIGKQSNATILPYETKSGPLELLYMGVLGADEMFTKAEEENMLKTWLIRLGGFFLMWLGAALVFGPLKVFADVIPLVGSIIGAGIGAVTGLITLALSFIVIALAWIFYRPLLGIALLLLAGLALYGSARYMRKDPSMTTANIGV